MSDATGFIPREFSLSPVDLIPPDDEDIEVEEVDERQIRYARVGRLVDPEDIVEMVCERLKGSLELRHAIEDALADPLDLYRPRIHINDALRLAQEMVVEIRTACDDQVGMLDAISGED